MDLKRMIRTGGKPAKLPLWRVAFVVGPVWCNQCGRSIHNDTCWMRDEPHKVLGQVRCAQCPPGMADRAERRALR